MSHFRLNAADKNLLDDVFSDYNVETRAPRWFKSELHKMADMAEMVDEIKQRGKDIRDTSGFGPLLNVRRAAHFPDIMSYAVVMEVNPDFLSTNEKHIAWLKTDAGRKFSLLEKRRGR